MQLVDDLRMAARFVRDLGPFLRTPLEPAAWAGRIASNLRRREEAFVGLVERAVLAHPRSPYRPLFARAKIGSRELAALVRGHGVEGALHRLYEAGVHVRLDEFKGRRPIRRDGLERAVRAADFDNPVAAGHLETQTGGTRGRASRLVIDLAALVEEADYELAFLDAFGLQSFPVVIWRPVPPGTSGIRAALRTAKLGRRADRWFSQNRLAVAPGTIRPALFTYLALHVSRWTGRPLPVPIHVPIDDPRPIVDWLAEQAARGAPVRMETTVSCGIRLCTAARAGGADITGTFLRLGGEPFTPAKASIVEAAGCRACVHYAMGEIGRIALACSHRRTTDDVHPMGDRVALIQQPVRVTPGMPPVGGLFLTTLSPATPKIMLNVEVGDYGVLEDGPCGCPAGRIGLTRRLHTIRSYEKLTSEGMHFMGSDLLELVESVLPARFGGHPTDYQFVEQEEQGLPRVDLVISPRVGLVNESEMLATVFDTLAAKALSGPMMTQLWRDSGTLRIARREPYATTAAKIQALHVLGPAGPAARAAARAGSDSRDAR